MKLAEALSIRKDLHKKLARPKVGIDTLHNVELCTTIN